ncbi:testosterone 17-beta-dehydrogenase 3 [Arthroderma uncinatum]|uniref:testosterone 17-beta-dehydrogenase 3 n=1 Tax=Arthroderma uncinatum TaxID=74035 RepID=UPI00144AC056|nr:testosterone 17-beta-dehydrogenase 3 [Arthroderma uncinatum]KAF3483868.1 testosterone 17-beta-dehydrogenase 3 [Arthroderma uncinatum]
MIWEKFFAAIGIATVFFILLGLLSTAYTFLHPSRLPKYLHDGKESYAFITGATDGVGRSMAYELAKSGFNLVLHGRNSEKLYAITEDLNNQYPAIKTRHFVFDASKDLLEDSVLQDLYKVLQGIHLTILVNNVGGMGCLPPVNLFKAYESYEGDQIDTVLNVNIRFMTQLTRILLPLLDHGPISINSKKAKRQPSLILNMGSVAAHGSPYVSVYTGTKAFVASFSNSLSMEMQMEGKDINVQVLILGEARSGSHIVKEGFLIPNADTYARSALKRVGSDREAIISGYFPHWIAKTMVHILPERVSRQIFINAVKEKKEAHEKRMASLVE